MGKAKFFTFLVLGSISVLLPTIVNAQSEFYYTHEEVRHCENQSKNTAVGAVGGAIFGGALGAIFGRGQAVPVVAGSIAGAAAGGLLGAGVSCHEQSVYIKNVDNYLYYAPADGYTDSRTHVVVIGSGYDASGHVCRTYHMDYYTAHGWAANESTACWLNGRWQHGYDAEIITKRVYANPRPRFYNETDDQARDGQRMFWAGRSERINWHRQHSRKRQAWADERKRRCEERELLHEDNRARARSLVSDIQRERYMERRSRDQYYESDYYRGYEYNRDEEHHRDDKFEHHRRRVYQ